MMLLSIDRKVQSNSFCDYEVRKKTIDFFQILDRYLDVEHSSCHGEH